MAVPIGRVNLRSLVSAVNDDVALIGRCVSLALFPVIVGYLNAGRECLLFGVSSLSAPAFGC